MPKQEKGKSERHETVDIMRIVPTTAFAIAAAVCAYAAPMSGGKNDSSAVDDSNWRGGPSADWFVNWDKALAESKKTNKKLFLLNTGSDWCGWCKKLRSEVLDKPEFAEFARKNLVLVYLDSPSRNPLGKEQKTHNRQIVKALPFGGGVPHVLVMNAKGEKLGAISGGGLGLDEYLEKLREICAGEGTPLSGSDAKTLFNDGYAKLAAEIAARWAASPSVTTNDSKAVLTGVAVKAGADAMSAADDALNRLWPSENAKRTAEPQQDKSKSAIDMLRERRRKSKEAVKQAILEPFLPFADAVRKAKEGDGAGLYSVAIHYARGVEIAPDSALAMKYLEKAVVARHANAALVKALIMEYQFKDSPDTTSDSKKMFDADDLSVKDHVSRRMLYERMGSRYASFRLPHDADWYCATNESAVAEIRCAYLEAKELGSPYAAEELNRFKRRMERVRKEAEERRAAEKAWRKKVDANARLAQEMLGETPATTPEYDPQRISLNLRDEQKSESKTR